MKKFFLNLLLLSMCSALFVACSDDDNDGDVTAVVGLKSFGFYAEDNSALAEDYIVPEITGDMRIAVPANTDISALVARFTTEDGNEVKINGVLQESGVTANDYTYPVDIIVTDTKSNTSRSYVITIVFQSPKIWKKITDFNPTSELAGDFAMKVNPKDNMPYIAYTVDDNGSDKLCVAKWNGSAFENVGAGNFSTAVSGGIDIAFDPDGIPYVLYVDKDNGTAATVMKYTGGNWSVVGNPGFSIKANASSGTTLAIDPQTKNPVVVTISNNASAAIARRAPELSYFNGASWVTAQVFTGRPGLTGTTYAAYVPVATTYGNSVYIAMSNNKAGYSLYKFTNGTIAPVVEGGFLKEGATENGIKDLSIDIDGNGNVFLCTVDNADTEDGNPRLFKYNLESGQLAIVGGAINNVFESHNFYKVAVDAQNTPFVVYRDYKGLKNSFVINLDNETKQWSDAFALNTASSERAFVDFNSNNDGFIGVLMEEGNVIELYTYADAD